MTLSEAKALCFGQTVYCISMNNADGTPQRWRVTSVKTWKREPTRIEVRLRHGLREHGYITEGFIEHFTLTEAEAIAHRVARKLNPT